MGAGCKKSAVQLVGLAAIAEYNAAEDGKRRRADCVQPPASSALTLACHLEDDPPVEPGAQEV